jgi:signal transduction histidine kinase
MVMFMSVGMKRALEVEARKVQIEEQDASSLRLLNNLTQTVLSVSPDLEHVLRSMASASREAVCADRGMAVLLQPADSSSETVPEFPNDENLLIIADADPSPEVLSPTEAQALAGALATHKPVRLHDKQPGMGGEGDASRPQIIVCVPFELNERVIGALFVERRAHRPFTTSEVSLLMAIGQQMAVAVRLARLYDLEREKAVRSAERERLERDLLSTVSHELRTPLTSIKTCIGALSESGIESSVRTPLETRMLNNIGRSTERLINLVNELLDMSRLHAGRVTLNVQELNLGETVLDAAAQVRPLLDARSQLLEVDLPSRGSARWNKLTTPADRRRIEQVLLNLLSNANKYGPTGSKIVVGATPRDGEVKVFVRDEGPGIARFEQRLVFDKFYQGSTAREDGGKPDSTGLGLSIARSIVELHGGRIGIGSKAGFGSTFYFTLPIEDGAAEARTVLSGDLVGSEL